MTRLFARGGGLFASAYLGAHLLRGVIAGALMYAAWTHQASNPFAALLAGVVALVALRGCPVCWTVGLIETLVARSRVERASTSSSRKN